MKATILDREALRAISPSVLAAHARYEGWRKAEPYGDSSDVYEAPGKPELLLPRTDQLGDYPTIVAKLIDIFTTVGGRDELSTYRELVAGDRDVVRVRVPGGEDDGSVVLDSGVEIVQQARQLLLAAACAAAAPVPQSLYRAGANKAAADYMRRVRLGQTEQGSFVVALLAPVPPQLQPSFDPTWAPLDDEPFERRVTRGLMSALEASRHAIGLAASGEGDQAFQSAVTKGVSANLCEALAGLIDQSSDIDISLTWARTRPVPEVTRRIGFSKSDADILREVARSFRARHPKPDVSLVGMVNKLRREPEDIEGLITLRALIDDKWQSVQALLDQANYSTAVRAHGAKAPVIARGDLERVGQRWQLTNALITQPPGSESPDEEATP